MGWKSTTDVSREEALLIILERLDSTSDEGVAEILEIVMGGEEHGSNYRVVKGQQ